MERPQAGEKNDITYQGINKAQHRASLPPSLAPEVAKPLNPFWFRSLRGYLHIFQVFVCDSGFIKFREHGLAPGYRLD